MSLIILLRDKEYMKHYLKYKIQVEHKPIPEKLLKDLPFDMKVDLLEEYNKLLRKWKFKNVKKHT